MLRREMRHIDRLVRRASRETARRPNTRATTQGHGPEQSPHRNASPRTVPRLLLPGTRLPSPASREPHRCLVADCPSCRFADRVPGKADCRHRSEACPRTIPHCLGSLHPPHHHHRHPNGCIARQQAEAWGRVHRVHRGQCPRRIHTRTQATGSGPWAGQRPRRKRERNAASTPPRQGERRTVARAGAGKAGEGSRSRREAGNTAWPDAEGHSPW